MLAVLLLKVVTNRPPWRLYTSLSFPLAPYREPG